MKILLVLLCILGSMIADDNATSDSNATKVLDITTDSNATLPDDINNAIDSKDSNATLPNQNTAQLNGDLPEVAKEVDLDTKLKNDIIEFSRVEQFKKNDKIDDPFIYVYPQSEQDLAYVLKVEQAVLVLKAIFENRANINNQWVEKGKNVEGWEVIDIQKNKVKLAFRDREKTLVVVPEKVKITKEVKY